MQTEYFTPTSIKQACKLYKSYQNPVYIAGGQSLVPLMHTGKQLPQSIIALDGIDDLHQIKETNYVLSTNKISIGAMATYDDIESSALLKKKLPGLVAMMDHLADRSVRAQATIGGALAFADPRADVPAGLLAIGAKVITDSRQIAMDDFIVKGHQSVLKKGELIKSVEVPLDAKLSYAKFRHPSSRWALVGIAVGVVKDEVRVVVTGAGSKIYRDTGFEKALSQALSVDAIANIEPNIKYVIEDHHAGIDYRKHLIKKQCEVAIKQLTAGL